MQCLALTVSSVMTSSVIIIASTTATARLAADRAVASCTPPPTLVMQAAGSRLSSNVIKYRSFMQYNIHKVYNRARPCAACQYLLLAARHTFSKDRVIGFCPFLLGACRVKKPRFYIYLFFAFYFIIFNLNFEWTFHNTRTLESQVFSLYKCCTENSFLLIERDHSNCTVTCISIMRLIGSFKIQLLA
jgi:hypothetical protein